ncbi:hypothetical protein ACTJKO_00520 [Curtobacterium sp. 22159]|uniref:hypothetical protein n=1 Tax=Curtobacterium sp. 22159 TaxID=3453882 RepID=UPI003F86DB49
MSFDIEEGSSGYKRLVLRGAWSAEAHAVWEGGDFDALELNYARGFVGGIDFLHGLTVADLTLIDRTVEDLGALYATGDVLRSATLAIAPRVNVDLELLPHVERLSIENWSQIASSIDALPGLRDLYAGGYGEADLQPLADAPGLRRLRLKDRPALASLRGVEAFHELEELQIVGARKLHDFGSLEGINDGLTRLWIESCKKLDDIGFTSRLNALISLAIADCGSIASISPIAGNSALQEVLMWESTDIADGDLSPLMTLPSLRTVRMKNRRHYVPTVGSIAAAIGQSYP